MDFFPYAPVLYCSIIFLWNEILFFAKVLYFFAAKFGKVRSTERWWWWSLQNKSTKESVANSAFFWRRSRCSLFPLFARLNPAAWVFVTSSRPFAPFSGVRTLCSSTFFWALLWLKFITYARSFLHPVAQRFFRLVRRWLKPAYPFRAYPAPPACAMSCPEFRVTVAPVTGRLGST